MSAEKKNSAEEENAQRKKKRRHKLTLLILMFLLLCALFIVQCELSRYKNQILNSKQNAEDLENLKADSLARYLDSLKGDSLARLNDSLARLQSLEDSLRNDSIAKANRAAGIDAALNFAKDKITADSIEKRKREIRDSIARADSLARLDSISRANRDSIPPEASIVPPPGRYFDPIPLKVKCDEIKCKVYLSTGDTAHAQELTNAITYNKTGDVFYAAEDSAGNRSKWQSAHYDMASDNVCGKNAYPVPVKGKTVCVDAYEYPNKADEVPKDMVSHEQAVRLCEETGKRLCAIEEWQAACRGKDNFKYSYGDSYAPSKCNTNTKAAKRSGRKEQCRSWYGMYDMNGNLWEWTSTPSKERETLFLVAGGAWDTQNASGCTENKFSFYPQNQYNFVGFRCCANAK